jgi:hypothetical protein
MHALFSRLEPGETGWSYREPLRVVTENPELAGINASDNVRLSASE